MPDKQITTISYAAGASLAAIALVYVFAPSFAIDEAATSSSRKKGVVGLRNYANDCFINSTLQALAGLGDLRIYLIRETHRRYIEDPAVYAHLVQPAGQALPQWKLQNLQKGIVSQGLKDMLDALNERPIYKKSTSAADFVKVLEQAFKQRISRQQQDAQEFLQIVAERLKDEYHAGERARAHARNAVAQGTIASQPVDGVAIQERLEGLAAAATVATAADPNSSGSATGTDSSANPTPPTIQTNGVVPNALQDEDEGFPMEGQHESQLECQTCGHKSAPKTETFVTLTLRVPQVRSTTLSSCFDEIFKTEYIDDFKCEKCRLVHAEEMLKKEIEKSSTPLRSTPTTSPTT
ncbi:Ubiquitin carboxyl-terminal hydrolase 16 like protein [Verticillium longisporum]|uniref:Ubiquitin carboxyl-terminal hydrolase 16 like protein n=1 Tax=Verticillium longisporum TaxID=100787 RepID=A0A8I2ZP57_VERLO|nr:Ubiquitin carboxyl-terminal hydrolase 16 like protein [Verticillium longisporum]